MNNFHQIKKLVLFLTLFQGLMLYNTNASAQSDSTMVNRLMKEAKSNMVRGNYSEADIIFRKILSLKVIIPDEFCYYYGETLFKLKNYRLSESFFEKYLELTENHGQFASQTQESIADIKRKLSEINECEECDEDGFLVYMQDCHICGADGKVEQACSRCKGRGEEVCPTCLGEGIEVLRTVLGEGTFNVPPAMKPEVLPAENVREPRLNTSFVELARE